MKNLMSAKSIGILLILWAIALTIFSFKRDDYLKSKGHVFDAEQARQQHQETKCSESVKAIARSKGINVDKYC